MKIELKKSKDRARGKIPKWVNFQNLVYIFVFLAFIFIIVKSESLSQFFTVIRPTEVIPVLTPSILPGTPTPLPDELIRTGDQTNGVILGAIIIIFAIIIGTAVILIRDRD